MSRACLGWNFICEMQTDCALEVVIVELKDIRTQLLALARRRRLKKEDAEDAVQDALAALAEARPEPANPVAYAEGVLWKRAARLMRKRKRTAEEVVEPPAPVATPSETLTDASEWAQAEAAMEQAIMWGDWGRTQQVIRSLAEVNPQRILNEQRFYLLVIAKLPKSPKQLSRDRETFAEMLRRALPRSSHTYGPRSPDAEGVSSGRRRAPRKQRPLPPDMIYFRSHDPETGKVRTVEMVTEYYLSRGVTLAERLAPKLSRAAAIALVREARAEVFPRWSVPATASPAARGAPRSSRVHAGGSGSRASGRPSSVRGHPKLTHLGRHFAVRVEGGSRGCHELPLGGRAHPPG